MRIAAIVPYAGSEKLVEMTERCVQALLRTSLDAVWAISNAAAALKTTDGRLRNPIMSVNLGFGRAVNHAIELILSQEPDTTHVLVANNDLEFPQVDWFDQLKAEIEDPYVLTPTTDVTAVPATRADGTADYAPTFIPQASAFCWLVPVVVIRRLEKRYGFQLFDSHFFAYGEDDLTGAILRHQFGKRPFKVIHRAWVHHLKGQTAKEIGVRPGDPKNLKLIAARKRALGVR